MRRAPKNDLLYSRHDSYCAGIPAASLARLKTVIACASSWEFLSFMPYICSAAFPKYFWPASIFIKEYALLISEYPVLKRPVTTKFLSPLKRETSLPPLKTRRFTVSPTVILN